MTVRKVSNTKGMDMVHSVVRCAISDGGGRQPKCTSETILCLLCCVLMRKDLLLSKPVWRNSGAFWVFEIATAFRKHPSIVWSDHDRWSDANRSAGWNQQEVFRLPPSREGVREPCERRRPGSFRKQRRPTRHGCTNGGRAQPSELILRDPERCRRARPVFLSSCRSRLPWPHRPRACRVC